MRSSIKLGADDHRPTSADLPRRERCDRPPPFAASRSANGSEKSASGRADSQARYTATQRAVSETLETSGAGMVHHNISKANTWAAAIC